ncbi:hypothetical protein PsorP6_002650 [Peronosclerospora sorghi]|uniref:Uncharacterized protein n=1 Tax=Peronosclerospora sorghi TaxID=230839 RepID=A0ACC0WSW8_9STRA|nr:hypothetical protein PsorP6_002650 [Peronosclerospora sorghi]
MKVAKLNKQPQNRFVIAKLTSSASGSGFSMVNCILAFFTRGKSSSGSNALTHIPLGADGFNEIFVLKMLPSSGIVMLSVTFRMVPSTEQRTPCFSRSALHLLPPFPITNPYWNMIRNRNSLAKIHCCGNSQRKIVNRIDKKILQKYRWAMLSGR